MEKLKSAPIAAILVVVLLVEVPLAATAARLHLAHTHKSHLQCRQQKRAASKTARLMDQELFYKQQRPARRGGRGGGDTVQIAGSSLPDCSHACGSCSPCRLVMVSFVCSSLEEAETCPMAYKCMCNSKSYPVP